RRRSRPSAAVAPAEGGPPPPPPPPPAAAHARPAHKAERSRAAGPSPLLAARPSARWSDVWCLGRRPGRGGRDRVHLRLPQRLDSAALAGKGSTTCAPS